MAAREDQFPAAQGLLAQIRASRSSQNQPLHAAEIRVPRAPGVENRDVAPADPSVLRREMVDRQLRARGIRDPRVLDSMAAVPREHFVGPYDIHQAYDDFPLPIGAGQTISQPYVVAFTLEAARIGPDDVVLDVGTGSGYAAAVGSLIAREVWSVECVPELAQDAAKRLAALGYDNVHVVCADGSLGWPEHAPYDVIVSAAAAPQVPPAWKEQLAPGGRIVAPIEGTFGQQLARLTLTGEGWRREDLLPVRYVRLIGEQGFAP